MKSTAATDLDRLVELGYDRDESRRALQTTRGDLREAKSILNGKASEQDNVNAWRQEIKGDFEAGIDCSAGNLERAENRASAAAQGVSGTPTRISTLLRP